MRPRVKICCMANPAEATMAGASGVDLVGLVGPMPSGAGIGTPEMCQEIAQAAPAWVTPVLLTSSTTAAAVEQDVQQAGVRTVQIVSHVNPSVHRTLADRLPGVRRLQVIHVEGSDSLDMIETYLGLADAYLLDSGRPSAGELGGTGRTHDWSISARFVKRSSVPVFLAGGLTPGNVTDAIRQVRPFGVDVCSGVRTNDQLDPSKLAHFMNAVEAA